MATNNAPKQTFVTKTKNKNIFIGFYSIVILFIVLGIDVYTLIYLSQFKAVVYTASIILIITYWLIKHFLEQHQKEIDKWYKGELGENATRSILDTLPYPFVSFNDVTLPNGYGNIDHVVVGQNGVFAIETKYVQPRHIGWKLQLSPEFYKAFCDQTYREAMDVRRFLEQGETNLVHVDPVLVLAHPDYKKSWRYWSHKGVSVVPLHLLYKYIRDHHGYIEPNKFQYVITSLSAKSTK